MFVRRGEFTDAEMLASLRIRFWQDQITKGLLDIPSLDADSLLNSSLTILKRPRASVYLAFQQTAISGYAYGQTRIVPGAATSLVAMIEEVYVDPVSTRQGIGQALLRNLIADLRDIGANRIQAKVLDKNKESRFFFEHCGFAINLLYYEFGDLDIPDRQ